MESVKRDAFSILAVRLGLVHQPTVSRPRPRTITDDSRTRISRTRTAIVSTMNTDSLQIDFGNVADMRAKLKHAKEIRDQKEEALRVLQQDAEWWRDLVKMIEQRVGTPAEAEIAGSDPVTVIPTEKVERDAPTRSDVTPLDMVVDIVNRESRAIQAREVAGILRHEGVDVDNAAVSNALFYAATRAKPPRLRKLDKRGAYAPLSFQPEPVAQGRIVTDPFGAHPLQTAAGVVRNE